VRTLSVPSGLRLAASLLLLCAPLAALETIVISRAPWWRLPIRSIALWSGAVFLVTAPLAAWVAHGRRWAWAAAAGFLGLWCLLSAWVAFRMRLPSVGFFTLFITLSYGLLLLWLRHEIGRSFYDPRIAWYQGLPRPIPSLRCRLEQSELRVSRLDAEGAFVIRGSGPERAPFAKGPIARESALTFTFRDREVSCRATLMRALADGSGAGFRFLAQSPDARKELGDFIETLRGEGYVD
jgi:hypothetical protein